MLLGVDRLREQFIKQLTPGVSFTLVSGTASVNTNFPITNIYDDTDYASYIEATRISRKTRIDYSAGAVFGIDIDLAAAKTVRYGLISGFTEQSVAQDAGGSSLDVIELQHSDDDVTYTAFKTMDVATLVGGVFELSEQIVLLNTQESHRYWRFEFSADTAGLIELGYAGVYGEWADINIAEPVFSTIDPSIVNRGLTGSSFIVERNEYDTHQVTIPANTDNIDALKLRNVLRHDRAFDSVIASTIESTPGIPADSFSPRTNPVFSVVYPAFDDGTSRGVMRMNERAQMILIRRDYSYQHDNKATIEPQVTYVFDEWQ